VIQGGTAPLAEIAYHGLIVQLVVSQVMPGMLRLLWLCLKLQKIDGGEKMLQRDRTKMGVLIKKMAYALIARKAFFLGTIRFPSRVENILVFTLSNCSCKNKFETHRTRFEVSVVFGVCRQHNSPLTWSHGKQFFLAPSASPLEIRVSPCLTYQ